MRGNLLILHSFKRLDDIDNIKLSYQDNESDKKEVEMAGRLKRSKKIYQSEK